ncbi:hypothetical protein V2G26_006559 [Clonostachys chloroleuca]
MIGASCDIMRRSPGGGLHVPFQQEQSAKSQTFADSTHWLGTATEDARRPAAWEVLSIGLHGFHWQGGSVPKRCLALSKERAHAIRGPTTVAMSSYALSWPLPAVPHSAKIWPALKLVYPAVCATDYVSPNIWPRLLLGSKDKGINR